MNACKLKIAYLNEKKKMDFWNNDKTNTNP